MRGRKATRFELWVRAYMSKLGGKKEEEEKRGRNYNMQEQRGGGKNTHRVGQSPKFFLTFLKDF